MVFSLLTTYYASWSSDWIQIISTETQTQTNLGSDVVIQSLI